jgi:putative hydrolase of the HAD superfamily
MIKVIGFDIGGVILSNCWSNEARKSICNQFNLTIDKEKMGKTYFRLLDQYTVGKITEQEFFTNMIQDNSFNLKKVKQLMRQQNYVQYPEVMRLLPQLKTTYQIALMNNEGKEWNEYRLRKFGLRKYTNHIISSCDINKMKPYKNYFQHCLKQLKIKPHQLLFIDNSIENIEAAHHLGIKTILFKNPHQLKIQLEKHKIKI